MKRNDERINERTKKKMSNKRYSPVLYSYCISVCSYRMLHIATVKSGYFRHTRKTSFEFLSVRTSAFIHMNLDVCACVRFTWSFPMIIDIISAYDFKMRKKRKKQKKIEPNNNDCLKKQHFNNWLENYIRLILHEWILLLLLRHRLFFWLRTATEQKLTARLIPIVYAFNFMINRTCMSIR